LGISFQCGHELHDKQQLGHKRLEARDLGCTGFPDLACTGLAYGLYFYTLAGAQPALIAALQYLEPLIAIVLALFLLQETVRPVKLLGGLMIIVGIVLVERTGVE
jgi:drug/metabolite transporter (DMT)-like permease